MKVAGCNGTMRRLTLSTSNISGMDDIDRIPCHELNESLSEKVLVLHEVCRQYFPFNLTYDFGPGIVLDGQPPSSLRTLLQARADVNNDDLPNIFTGTGQAAVKHDPILLTLVKDLAKEIVVSTLTTMDSSIAQETKNLVSLIGQNLWKCI